MRRLEQGALVLTMVGLGLSAAAGCTLFEGDGPQSLNPDAGEGGISGDGSVINSSQGQLRVAFFPTGTSAVSGVDLCVAVHGSTVDGGSGAAFQGPLLAAQNFSAGVPAGSVSQYVEVDPGQVDVRVVPAGTGATCESAGAVTLDHAITLTAGGSFTLLVREQNGSPSISLLPDEAADKSGAKVRFVNVLDDKADFGLGGGVAYTPLAQGVLAGSIATLTDPNGYLSVPLSQTVHVDSTVRTAGGDGGTDLASSDDLALAPSKIMTVFAYTAATDGGSAPALVACDDSASGSAGLGSCSAPTTQAALGVRFADFVATDLGDVNVCVRYAGLSSFAGPVLGSTLSHLGLSDYVSLHAGFAYEVALASAASGATPSCTSPIDQTTGTFSVPAANTAGTTVVVMGYVQAGVADAGVTDDAGDDGSADASVEAAIRASADDDAAVDSGVDAASPVDAGSGGADSSTATTGPALAYTAFAGFVAGDDGGATAALPVVEAINAAADESGVVSLSANYTGSGGDIWAITNIAYDTAGSGGSSTAGSGKFVGTFLPVDVGIGTLTAGATSTSVKTHYDLAINDGDIVTYFLYGGGAAGVGVVACTDVSSAPTTCQVLTRH